MVKGEENPCILFLGTFPPRECGIATFTQDISNAVQNRLFPSTRVKIAAMNRNGINIYNYPEKVIHQINDADIDEYIETAKKINNQKNVKLVSIQHEFGIFGGEYGSYIIPFLEILKKPCVITLHSILPDPSEQMRKVVQSMAEKSSAFIVMAEKGKEILREAYGVKNDIFVVPHGIPTASFESPLREKSNLGYKGRIVLSSFGMVAPGKGYEDVIESLPEVVKKFPNLLYLIVGETHPIVRKKEGEAYRNSLEEKIKKLGLQKNVKFYNKYMKLNEIIKYLKASDIYISSGQDPNQVTSGTLVYAMGCGRPVKMVPIIYKGLPIEIIPLDFKLDGSFPSHVADPSKLKNVKDIKMKVCMTNSDFGIAFDGDTDRVFFINEHCKRVNSSITASLMIKNLFKHGKKKSKKIVYSSVMSKIIPEIAKRYGGKAFREKVGHTFIKSRMRKENAVFGAEHSGHFYYKDNFYADSGIITSLIMCEIFSKQKGKFSDMVKEFQTTEKAYEQSIKISNQEKTMNLVKNFYKKKSKKIDNFDGITISFDDWWFNIRKSNTEPVLRLNMEAKTKKLLNEKKREVLKVIKRFDI